MGWYVVHSNSTVALPTLIELFPCALDLEIETHGEAGKGQVKAKGWACDVASEENVQKVFSDIEKEYGRIDVSALSERGTNQNTRTDGSMDDKVLVTAAGIVENFSAIDCESCS